MGKIIKEDKKGLALIYYNQKVCHCTNNSQILDYFAGIAFVIFELVYDS